LTWFFLFFTADLRIPFLPRIARIFTNFCFDVFASLFNVGLSTKKELLLTGNQKQSFQQTNNKTNKTILGFMPYAA